MKSDQLLLISEKSLYMEIGQQLSIFEKNPSVWKFIGNFYNLKNTR